MKMVIDEGIQRDVEEANMLLFNSKNDDHLSRDDESERCVRVVLNRRKHYTRRNDMADELVKDSPMYSAIETIPHTHNLLNGASYIASQALDVLADIELLESLRSSLPKGSVFHLRIELHCGPAFAGICYMVVSGLPYPAEDHALRLASLALEMIDTICELPSMVEDVHVNTRIGLHSGSVVAGIIGKNKYAHDLWGDAVNTASRMECHGEAGRKHCSTEFVEELSRLVNPTQIGVHFTERGEIEINGKGRMRTYFLEKRNVL